MYCKYGMVIWYKERGCTIYQRAAAYCMRSSYALQVRHGSVVHVMGLHNIPACSCMIHAL
jgi:hypothetical protein